MAREKVHSLFRKQAADLAAVCSDYPGRVLCPLCLTAFGEDAIDLAEPELTEEHVIPSELGGRLLTLTCKRCNNLHGAEIDSHLIQRLRVEDSLEGAHDWPLKGRLEVAGMRAPADVDWRAHRNEMTQFRLRQFNPVVHDAIRESLRSRSVDTINVHFSFDYIPYRTDIGILRIAYLAAFRAWGYGYILSPAVQVVRNLINDFENVNEEVLEIVGQIRDISPVPQEPVQFLWFAEGPAIMAIIRLRAVTRRHYATFLPVPGGPPEEVFDILLRTARGVRQRMQRKDAAEDAK
jgi:HNH endonuclease